MIRVIVLALLAVATEANQYYYAPLGPWGLESTIISAKSIRKDSDIKEVKTTSLKEDKDEVKKVKSNPDEDDLEKAEEAFFHAVEEVEHVVEKAIDEEVETLFPHHQKTESEE